MLLDFACYLMALNLEYKKLNQSFLNPCKQIQKD